MQRTRIWILCLLCLSCALPPTVAQPKKLWRAATAAELEAFLPARAQVQNERIETEMRTATGITDDHGKMIAGVVLITAGYSADGKYSHYMLLQSPMHIGSQLRLGAGAYVLGWTRVPDGLQVRIFDAATGVERGEVMARALTQPVRIESFRIWPPAEREIIQIGRFAVPYSLDE
jgi:hypothetical protein